jgi:hypothetical protein
VSSLAWRRRLRFPLWNSNAALLGYSAPSPPAFACAADSWRHPARCQVSDMIMSPSCVRLAGPYTNVMLFHNPTARGVARSPETFEQRTSTRARASTM